jgi:lipopolysaccharide export system protein LptA
VQRTIRILRVALPLTFIAFVTLIALSWHRTKAEREKAPGTPVTSTIRPKDRAQVVSTTFEDTQTINGRLAARIRAARVVAFQSGWNTLEGVELTIYRPTGLTYELSCPQAQFNSASKEAEAKGGVRVTSSDGVMIQTAEIHFDGNRLTNHIPVRFTVDRWNGTAGAIDLDVQAEAMRLFEKIDATMTPATPAESGMNLKAQEGIFRRKENTVDFTQQVVLLRDLDRVSADQIGGRFAADRKGLQALQGVGHVIVDMGANSTAVPSSGQNLAGRKTITADRFWSEIGLNGQMSAIDAAGDTSVAHAVIEGPPHRDLWARVFRAGLANKVVTELKADGEVVMKESGPTPRDMSADHVNVYFDPATHKARNAIIEGNFKYKDPKNQANAIRAVYDIENDRVVLSAEPGFNPTVIADGQTLKATQIEFSPRAGTARATGSVIAQLVSRQGGVGADSTNVFPASKPVFVNSDAVTMQQTTKVAVFSGNVRAWQETNTLFCRELQVQGMGDSITARGGVRSILYNTSSSATAEARKTPIQSVSEQLLARKGEKRIDLTGNVKIDDDQRHLTADHASFFFDAARHIDRIEAEKQVVLTDSSTGQRGTGDKAIYLVAKKLVYMTGSPATALDPRGGVSAQQIVIDLVRNKAQALSTTGPLQGTYKPPQ